MMKSSAASNRGAHAVASTSPLSQIPLPKRKNSAKEDKGLDVDADTDTGSEYGHVPSAAPRSHAKMSLLGSTTFCCASGQKEDYIPDAKIVPAMRPPKKRPPNAKKEQGLEQSTPKSPLLAAGRNFLSRNKKGKVENGGDAVLSVSLPSSPVKQKATAADTKPHLPNFGILRPPDNSKKATATVTMLTPPSPQRRLLQREPAIPRRDTAEAARKYSDAIRKYRKETRNQVDATAKCNQVDATAKCNHQQPVAEQVASFGCGDVLMARSHESEDFDCPCCDRASLLMDEAGLSDIEVKMFTSCDVIADETPLLQVDTKEVPNEEKVLKDEVQSLKEDLKSERLKLQTQQDKAQRLEDELSVMQQLRQELDKEKELRKIAEDKLLELLDYEKRSEMQKKENEKHTESKSTQMDITEAAPDFAMIEKHSPLLYEGRLRKYQTYIAKLENDNLMLVNELKKFKDLSPRSQEEQAKFLVEKLGRMERNNQQQQVQYETYLDDVAHKLVHMLIVQKKLEEECRILHLRVEQLEQENGTLMELIEDDKVQKVETVDNAKVSNVPSANLNAEHHKPSRHPITSSPLKKLSTSQKVLKSSENRKDFLPKSANASPTKKAYAEPRSGVTSPVSSGPKLGCSSKIPSFGTSKPVLFRKKSEADIPLTKNRVSQKDTNSEHIMPNSRPTTSRSKLPSTTKPSKTSSAKRKRLSRNGSPSDKGVKDSKQRIKSNHSRWDPHKDSPDDFPPPYSDLSPIPIFPQPQHVWSFNCEVNTNLPVPEINRKIADSIEAFSDKLSCGIDHSDSKQTLSTSDSSTAIEGANRTRDEGYSTMSSDLQPDSSTADTTISEADHSATYVIAEKTDACNSDDSVTECLDGSMCSSSDSGFGPLFQVATLKFPTNNSTEEPNRTLNDLPKFDSSSRKHGTVKSKEQIASVKPTVRNVANTEDQSQQTSVNSESKSNTICDHFSFDCPKVNSLTCSPVASPIKSKKTDDFDNSSPTKQSNENKLSNVDQSTMIDYWSFPKEILALKNYRKTWHLGPTETFYDDQIVFCTRHSYIDDNLFDEKVETAEKATLTEPEEELWREKALAPFIDESIWSLYSSEGDIQIKHFPIEPIMSEPSLEKLITNCSPCIIVTENVEADNSEDEHKTSAFKSSNNSSFSNLNNAKDSNSEGFRSGLERVASDTVLYLKDAIHELEDSMRRGLKSSKNIPALHQNSGSESEASPSRDFTLKPEILKTLEATLREQNSALAWTSPSRSSSLSSVQSSASCHAISDEMEDVDIVHTSRKGSQDPDLSSASDAEYENLDHKDFVERWLQKEVACNNSIPKMVPVLETVEEIGECSYMSVKRKTSLPCDTTDLHSLASQRTRFKSYPNDCNTPSPERLFPSSTEIDPLKMTGLSDAKDFDNTEDAELQCLDPEAKEFNGDFYTLCSIGSNKSLDHSSPSRTREMTFKQLVESPVFKCSTKNTSKGIPIKTDKLKPTGLVKPTRPLTLAVPTVPSVPRHTRQISKSDVPSPNNKFIQKPKIHSISSPTKVPRSPIDVPAKINITAKVPLKNRSVFQNGASILSPKSPEENGVSSNSLPASTTNDNAASVKAKSPTKIIFRNRSPTKKDRCASRQNRLKEGCGTAWIHLQADPALSDPSVRSSLLDSIKAPSSSSGSSDTEEEVEGGKDVLVIQTNSHLHKICKERRHKAKASANNPLYDLRKRSSIMGRRELFYRFGEKEQEAIACFDFLEKIPSVESLGRRTESPTARPPPSNLSLANRASTSKERITLQSPGGDISKMALNNNLQSSKMAVQSSTAKSPSYNNSARQLKLPNLWNKPLGHNMSSSTLNSMKDCELLDHISLSDSCAESYSSTPESYDDAS